jgi:HlyD family secretion protein
VTNPSHDLSKLRIDRDAPAPRRGISTRALVIGIGALVLVTVLGFALARPKPIQVQVAVPEPLTSGAEAPQGATAVTANGYVVARTRASVAAKVPGRLASLAVDEGTYVQKGAVIARLESADYAAGVDEARANLASSRAVLLEVETERDQAQRELDRVQRIRNDRPDLTSAQEVEVAQSRAGQARARATSSAARVDAAEAALRYAQALLENTYIRAPFTGTVLRKEAEVGEVVAPSVGGGLTRGAVVTMADLSTLEVEVDVNEAYIGRVSRGQEARITLDAYPDTSFRGRVRQVVPTADRQRATVQVKVAITDRDPRILSEMGSRVDFLAATEPVGQASSPVNQTPRFRLPAAAVKEAAGKTVVWVVRGGKLESKEVQAGPVSAGFREIRGGLLGGEQVVMSDLAAPVVGMRVEITPAP